MPHVRKKHGLAGEPLQILPPSLCNISVQVNAFDEDISAAVGYSAYFQV
jgi:hypothetical protein